VVRHAVDGEKLLTLAGNDAADVFLQLLLPVREDEVLPALNGEDNVNVDLRVGVGHGFMPLLPELCWFSLLVTINMALLTELRFAAESGTGGVDEGVGEFILDACARHEAGFYYSCPRKSKMRRSPVLIAAGETPKGSRRMKCLSSPAFCHDKVCSDREFVDQYVGGDPAARRDIVAKAEKEGISPRTADRYLQRLVEAGVICSGGGLYWRREP